MENLWSVQTASSTSSLPVLVRTGGNINSQANLAGNVFNDIANLRNVMVYSNGGATDIIDVVNDFQWTKSPVSSRKDVPYLTIKEKRVVLNSVVSNIANSVLATKDVVVNNVGEGLKLASETEFGTEVANQAASIGQYVKKLATNTPGVSDVTRVVGEVVQSASDVFTNSSNRFDSKTLQPYNNLYTLEETGFKYKLPYFENDASGGTSGSFGEGDTSFLSTIEAGTSMVANIASYLTTFLKPGVYIERSKQFAMSDTGRTITVNFPLLNTGSVEDKILNWQLLFALAYQNKPGRITRSIIDLPVIYELNMPGIVYIPFAFVSNMSVSFIGSRRMMTFSAPVGLVENKAPGETLGTITTIIPDAYQVSISFTGLNADTRNFMYASINPSAVTNNAISDQTRTRAINAIPGIENIRDLPITPGPGGGFA